MKRNMSNTDRIIRVVARRLVSPICILAAPSLERSASYSWYLAQYSCSPL
jgi:hypothetical protein